MRKVLMSALAAGLVLLLASPSWAAQAKTRVVSKTGGGTLGDGDSMEATISGSGRYVAFGSSSTNLPGDDLFEDVYRKDMRTGAIRLISRTRGGDPADDGSFDPSISANGRFVAFSTDADNLPGDPDEMNVVVKDMQSGRVLLGSRTSGGVPGNDFSADPSISANGRFVAFESSADNLGGDPDDTNVFIHDLETRKTRLVSKTSAGAPSTGGDCNDPAVSSSGRFVAFECAGTDNLPGQGAATDDQTYIHDRKTGKTRLISKNTGGDPADGDSEDPSVSGSARFVAFESFDSTNLPGSDVGDQVYVHDRRTGRTRLISKTTGGEPADGISKDASLSLNGRFVAFESQDSTNLPAATDWDQVYRHDRERARTIHVSKNNAGEAADDFANLARATRTISADGSFIAFQSVADNLGGGSTDQQVYRRGPLP
jgi:Tol biopolymer transport system component